MKKSVPIILMMLLLFSSGCLQKLNETKKVQINVSEPAIKEEPFTFNTSKYSKLLMRFNYPANLEWEERLNNYSNGTGYAAVFFTDPKNNLLITYLYTGNLSNVKDVVPYDLVTSNLESESNAERDPLGILHYVVNKSSISQIRIEKGYASYRRFIAVKKNIVYYGIAMSIFVPESKVLYGFRAYSTNGKTAEAITKEFIDSVVFLTEEKENKSVNTVNNTLNVSINANNSIS